MQSLNTDFNQRVVLRTADMDWQASPSPTVWRKRTEGASSNPFRRNFKYVAMALSILTGPSHRTEARSSPDG